MIEEFALELAESRIAKMRDERISEIRESLKPSGATFCKLCKEKIEARRLAALPSAKTCFDCMQILESL